MRRFVAAFVAVSLFVVVAAPAVEAAPTQVNVRIEGKAETLFEGPILTEGHKVRAASDTEAPAGGYRCNGLNNKANPTPGPTPTAAAVDAMSILGEDFDGKWYGADFEDYFIKRWGPGDEDLGAGEHWGIAVNNVYTNIGGCQYKLDEGDEVFWIYDAFRGRPRLALYPVGYAGGAVPSTATAVLDQPFEIEVDSWSASGVGQPPASPTRSTTPYAGAEIAPVTTNSKGFQKVDTASPETVVTAADGRASITFTEPGWHRIKAADFSAGAEIAVRSNRLDVCVPLPPASDCGAPPPDVLVRTPPPVEEGDEVPPSFAGQGGPASQAPLFSTKPLEAGQVRLQFPRLDRSRIARGLVKVSWRVLDVGPGVEGWTISSTTLGRKGAGWVSRASGRDRTVATLRLPPAAAHRLQLTVTDVLGRSSSASIGRVQVPR